MEYICKKIDINDLSHSSIHHLLAIHNLIKENGYARGIDVAKHLDLTRGSVSITLRKLVDKGYISEDENKFLKLTEKGIDVVNSVVSKRHIIESLFRDVLHLSAKSAEIEGCKIGYLINQETSEKLLSFIGYCLSDNPVVNEFWNKFKDFQYQCKSADNCHICETDCFFAGEDIK